MKFNFSFLFILLCLQLNGQLDCESPDRYREFVFDINDIETFDEVYAQFTNDDLWNNGDTTLNIVCFDPRDFMSSPSEDLWEISYKVYRPKSSADQCINRPAVIFIHGGGYNYAKSTNEGNGPVSQSIDLARRGYVVISINYRKGWDMREARNVTLLGPLVNGCQNCACENGNNDCRAESFMKMNYSMMQDARAAHRKVANDNLALGIDPNKIFYMGVSTGAVGALHAAYAVDDLPLENLTNGESFLDVMGDPDKFGESLNPNLNFEVAGVASIAGSISRTDWVEAEDDIPLFMIHTARDEAVPYCQENILSMRYLQLGNPNYYLQQHGPGRIYKHVRCLEDSVSTTKMRLISLQGLFHSFTAPLGSQDPSDNCDSYDDASEVAREPALFFADIIDQTPISDSHLLVFNAHIDGPCETADTINYTQCTAFTPCDLSLSTFDLEDSSTYIYPNPVQSGTKLQINDHLMQDAKSYSLFNHSGSIVLSSAVIGNNIPLPMQLTSGIYYLNISDGEESRVFQIVIID